MSGRMRYALAGIVLVSGLYLLDMEPAGRVVMAQDEPQEAPRIQIRHSDGSARTLQGNFEEPLIEFLRSRKQGVLVVVWQGREAFRVVAEGDTVTVIEEGERTRTYSSKQAPDVFLLRFCEANLRSLGTALEMYSTDNEERSPARMADLRPGYLRVLPTCPAARRDTYSASYQHSESAATYTISCQGRNHTGLPPDRPMYNSHVGAVRR